ncbi:MAG: hypothetical protein ACYTGZ_00080 [Planctomycetota bacterium]|jgi:hypothetical protein
MIERDKTRLFRRRLRELELIAGDPVIPGEVGDWCETVGETLGRVRNAWAPVLGVHESAFRGILETNLEMGGLVERLRIGDTNSSRTLASLTQVIDHARRHCDPDITSEEPVDEIAAARSELLNWVAQARGHEQEVDRWLLESAMRDSGFSD